MAAARGQTRSRTDRKLLTAHLYEIHVRWRGGGVFELYKHPPQQMTCTDEGRGPWALVVYGK